ncbi:dUMP phosphatase, partial [Enterobacter kobei]
YRAVSRPLGVDYQNGAVTAVQLRHPRFDAWSERFTGIACSLAEGFVDAMAEMGAALAGAVARREELKGTGKLGSVASGCPALEQIRVERSGLRGHFDARV